MHTSIETPGFKNKKVKIKLMSQFVNEVSTARFLSFIQIKLLITVNLTLTTVSITSFKSSSSVPLSPFDVYSFSTNQCERCEKDEFD